jgi:hypothetical protein
MSSFVVMHIFLGSGLSPALGASVSYRKGGIYDVMNIHGYLSGYPAVILVLWND